MQPSTRIAFNFPIYALDLLPDGTIAIAGGGGLMKSGIPNKCALLSFDPNSISLSERASIDLPDAVVALAASSTTLYSIIGVGVKNFSYSDNTLTTQSSFRHDLRVSATQDQSAIVVSADLSTLVVASDEGHVVSLSLPRYEKLFSAHLHTQGVTDLAISHDATLVATTSRDRSAYIWRSRTGQIDHILKPVMPPDMRTHIRAIRFCQSNPDIIFTIESNPRKGGWIAAWQRPRHTHETAFKPIASLKISADAITTCSVNSDGTLIAASSSEGHVMLLSWGGSSFSLVWSTETKSNWFSPPKPPHNLPITGLRFSKSGDYFFSASADYAVAAWPIKRPTDCRRIRRLTLWLLNMLILMFAILVLEDHALPSAVSYHRSTLQPYLEPHLSKIQGNVRPFIRDRQSQIQSYLIEIQHTLQSRQKLPARLALPHVEKPREHNTLWKSKLLGTCERISQDYNCFSSSASSRTEGKDQGRENFDGGNRKTRPNLQRSREEALIHSETHSHEKLTNEMPSRTLIEPGLNTDNARRIHGRSDKQLHSPQERAFVMKRQPAGGISRQQVNSFEKVVQGERATTIRFGEQVRHKRNEEEEFTSSENEVRSFKATETIDHDETVHSERRRGSANSSSDLSVETHKQVPADLTSESRSRVAQSSNAKGSEVSQFQNPASGSDRDSLGVASQELPKGSKPDSNLSAVNLKSSKHDCSSEGKTQKAEGESAGNKNVFQENRATSVDRNSVTIAETDKDPVLARARGSIQAAEAMTVSDELMERDTFGSDREILEPPETFSHPIREGSGETTSRIFVAEENLLEEVYAGVDSILAESSDVFGK